MAAFVCGCSCMVSSCSSHVAAKLLDVVLNFVAYCHATYGNDGHYSESCSLLRQPIASQDAGNADVLRVNFAYTPTAQCSSVRVSM